MKVLLSIKPEYAEKILSGEKHYEFRKVLPKVPGIKTVVIYATMPVGKVVGEFDIAELVSETPKVLWAKTSNFSGITRKFFNEYFEGRKLAHAFKVEAVRRYGSPVELRSILRSGVAPQSFCYLN
ncbi:ASCH domain-containing protein [Janthinobacterium sp. GB1R12]|uniref:ASCH domain-containing protein n=1 Tax=Janthinobacterium sp. GB1R12 TaxID=3424190 RepID=UPI003F28CF55